MPDGTCLLLTLTAADATGSPALLWAAARRSGLDLVTATGLVDLGTRVRFCHPLARSAVYRAAPPQRRRTAHALRAEVTDPDRRAWHRGQTGVGPDDAVAADLERSAGAARSRCGVQAAAAFLNRAAALTLDPGLRAERTLAAARAQRDAGRAVAIAGLLADVEYTALDDAQRGVADLVRGAGSPS